MSNVQERKVALVTGASQGIGADVVNAYRKLGFAVVATSRSIGKSAEPDVLTIQGDIADSDTAERVVTQAIQHFGRIDTLVNNAGAFIAKPFTDYTEDEFKFLVGLNLNGFFRITQLAVPHMLTQGGGHIVNITTSLVDQPHPDVPSVLASLTKGGIQSATKSLAIEYATRGIRVNAVSPGYIKTAIHPEETHETLASMLPVRRMGETNDIAEAVSYLETASFVTGEILHVDGGQNAGH
jgi:NAD(P)-dependent dehydrogenase (short-subunit alcohol dehydrogenase family)